jgi:isocitrate dehydrogenase kinase/phosphatase
MRLRRIPPPRGCSASRAAARSGDRQGRLRETQALAKVRLIPKKTDALMQRLNQNSQSYIRAEEEELLTLNWHCVGEKPT